MRQNGAEPNGLVAATTITALASGFLVIDASSDLGNASDGDLLSCFIEVNNAIAPGSEMEMELNGRNDVNREEDCSTNAVVPVSAGTHRIELELVGAGSNTSSNDRVLSAIYVPFGGTGVSPSSAAIFSAREKTPESR